jgi:hypothetical protein
VRRVFVMRLALVIVLSGLPLQAVASPPKDRPRSATVQPEKAVGSKRIKAVSVTNAGRSLKSIGSSGKLAVSKTPVTRLSKASRFVERGLKSDTASSQRLSYRYLYHATSRDAFKAISTHGFRTDIPSPQVAFHRNRFGRGVYLSTSAAGAHAERPGGVTLRVRADVRRPLDLRARGPITDLAMAKAIARGARKHGYDAIVFRSIRPGGGGTNIVVFDSSRIRVLQQR